MTTVASGRAALIIASMSRAFIAMVGLRRKRAAASNGAFHISREPSLIGFAKLCNRYGNDSAKAQTTAPGGADGGHDDSGRLGPPEKLVEVTPTGRDQVAALVLAEKGREGRGALRLGHGGPDPGGNRHLGQGYSDAAIREIVHRGRLALADETA